MDERLQHLLATDGVIKLSTHRSMKTRILGAVKRGDLVKLLPGVYAADDSFQSKVLAAHAWDPNCIIIGEAAAKLTWRKHSTVDPLGVATSRQPQPVRGFAFHRMTVPEGFIVERAGLRFAHPALAVLQMLPTHGPDIIDEALRTGTVRLSGLRAALEANKHLAGNHMARRWIEDSRDQPWSALERRGHRGLREAGVTGWQTNHPVQLPGRWAFLDIAFQKVKLAIELDGWSFHCSHESFINDRERDLDLNLLGWRVLRFTDSTLHRLVPAVQEILSWHKP